MVQGEQAAQHFKEWNRFAASVAEFNWCRLDFTELKNPKFLCYVFEDHFMAMKCEKWYIGSKDQNTEIHFEISYVKYLHMERKQVTIFNWLIVFSLLRSFHHSNIS